MHAVAPAIDRLEQENEELREGLQRAAKAAIDRELDAAVPNWRQVNVDERFHNWLLMPDPYSGVIRDRLLKDAARAGSAQRVINIFQGFLQEAGASQPAQAGQPGPRQTWQPARGQTYSRQQILDMARLRRQGKIDDKAWARWEHEIVRAGREGRVAGALDIRDLDGVRVTR